MPELPEIETIKRELAKALVDKTIKQVKTTWPKMVLPLSPQTFAEKLVGQKIKSVERRAKMLFIHFNNDTLLAIHLKMTGQLIYQRSQGLIVGGHPQKNGLVNLPNNYTRAIFTFTDGSVLYFNDLRKFGWLKHLPHTDLHLLTARSGVEPLTRDFSLALFKSLLTRYPKRPIKTFLLDQTLIAGLGNIYVDEACFLSHILPTRLTNSLSEKEITNLHKNIISVLKLSIQKKGTSTRNYVRADGQPGGFVPHLMVYGRAKLPCKICRTPIAKIRFHGRGTHFCRKCQK
ncbi:MAG: bifunctional DNA-formamidopyrimidine glycosylase/DNA-(apurinic or apyrimidinic site) lyase [Candidatus Vogelbacteria bacterium]|nr:bifunctional DNA-formamidopyrimidine glycosylase/DNA-(apurinic or apyrimidinic site) lyase [Candidatus Vogelbacteria bacterium]